MNITIDKTEDLADQLAGCEVGDVVTITGKVTSDDPSAIEIEATKAEYPEKTDDGEPAEEGTDGEPPTPSPMRKKTGGNPAIALILGGGKEYK